MMAIKLSKHTHRHSHKINTTKTFHSKSFIDEKQGKLWMKKKDWTYFL